MITWQKQNSWERVNIKKVCSSIIDCVNKIAKKVDFVTPYKMLRTTNIKNGWVDLENVNYVTEEIYRKWTRRQVPTKGDVILTREAPLGEVGLLRSEDKVFLGQRLVAYRADPQKLDNKFLLYSFLSHDLISQVKSFGSGSTVEHMRVPDAEKLTLLLPSLDLQKKISSIIASYDDLIENNEKRIRILEEMCQRLYTEWFVKFKFPGHEKVKIVKGIPKDWEYKRIDNIAAVIRGASYSSEQINDDYGYFYLVNLKSFNRGGGFNFKGVKYFNGIVKKNQLLKQGDIVVAVTDMTTDRAVISRPARIPNIKSDKITFSADVVKIVPEKLPFAYVYYSLLDYRFTETTKNKANGANVLHLKPQAISEYKVLVPTKNILKKFEMACGNMVRLVDKLSEKNEKLNKIRDLLIPQLVTGKINIC